MNKEMVLRNVKSWLDTQQDSENFVVFEFKNHMKITTPKYYQEK